MISRPNMRNIPKPCHNSWSESHSLQREIEELEMLSAAAEEKQHDVPGGTC